MYKQYIGPQAGKMEPLINEAGKGIADGSPDASVDWLWSMDFYSQIIDPTSKPNTAAVSKPKLRKGKPTFAPTEPPVTEEADAGDGDITDGTEDSSEDGTEDNTEDVELPIANDFLNYGEDLLKTWNASADPFKGKCWPQNTFKPFFPSFSIRFKCISRKGTIKVNIYFVCSNDLLQMNKSIDSF
jgi:hypothetical protein